MELILENVRCFVGRHRIPVKPLTVLIGENSSGKSTMLATLSIVCNTREILESPNFNEPPYSLGGFDTIASSQNGGKSRVKHFALGRIDKKRNGKLPTEMLATFRNHQGQPELLRLSAEDQKNSLQVHLEDKSKTYKYHYVLRDKEGDGDYPIKRKLFDTSYLTSLSVLIIDLTPVIETLSIAPVRTRPKRTYDEIENYNPEGDHVPFVLARLLKESSDSKQRKAVLAALLKYGNESELFDGFVIRNLGDNPGDPFQVMVTVAGRPANLLDVGYGVSQALPVVVQSVLAAKERLLLLQQPEVHLHPKAQAALGSFFVDMVADAGKQFVIETHSDYIVDRIRQEVAAKKIKPDDVALLFFEKKGIETTIHNLQLDDLGNITNAPPTYREFFLTERLNLLTRGNR